MTEPIVFREYEPQDSIAQITRLLHQAYAPLTDDAPRFLASYQAESVTRQRLKLGYPLLATSGQRIVGTITFYLPDPKSDCAWYARPDVCRFGQFAVHPEMQRKGIGSQLLAMVEARAREHGAAELALNTAEGYGPLRDWYKRRGFRFIQYLQLPDADYRSVVLSKTLEGSPEPTPLSPPRERGRG